MDEIKHLRAEIDELKERLKNETCQRLELERRCALLEKLAFRDPATGLRTESYLYARVREEIDRSTRFPSATTLVTLCMDERNEDNIGQMGHRLSDGLRATDQVFQLSSHGLAVLLVETPEEGAHHLIQRLAEDIEQFVKGYGFTVTSFPVDANLADDFLRMAFDRHRDMASKLLLEKSESGRRNN